MLNKIDPLIKLIISIILIFTILICKSLYLYLFIVTLLLFIYIVLDIEFSDLLNYLCKIKVHLVVMILLILIFIDYIFILKYLLIIFILFELYYVLSFMDILDIIYITIHLFKINDSMFINISSFVYYIKCFIEMDNSVKMVEKHYYISKNNLISKFIQKLILCDTKTKYFKSILLKSNYKVEYRKTNLISKFYLIFFILMFIVTFIRDVVM